MDYVEIIQLVLTIFLAGWGVYEFFARRRIEEELHRLTVGLDQSIQLLHRTRDAAISLHKSHLYMLSLQYLLKEFDKDLNEKFAMANAEYSAYWSELRGLAFAIADDELLRLVNRGHEWIEFTGVGRSLETDEMTLRRDFQPIHTRIAKLIEERAKKDSR